MDFLWRVVDEREKESIKKEAKKLMDNFAKALSKIEKEKIEFKGVRREKHTRKESTAEKCDFEFRKIFLQNAPEKDGDFIRAEKGKWK